MLLNIFSVGNRFYLTLCLLSPLIWEVNQVIAKNRKTVAEQDSKVQDAVQTAYLDFSSIITDQERSDWILDEYALRKVMPKIAEVYCQLSALALQRLEKKIEAQTSGHLAKDYYDTEKSKDEDFTMDQRLRDLLHQERINLAFRQVKKHKAQCPFWLTRSNDFMGIHRDAGRLQLIAETMGGFQLQKDKDSLFIGGAGQGRLIGIYGFTTSWGFGLGIEAGGASTFPKDEQGRRSLKAQWTAGVPLLWRGWWDNKRFDVELTPVARFEEQTMTQGHYGGRFAVSFGISPLRIFGFLPHIMGWIGVEQFFDQDSTLVLRAGTRIGFSL